VIGVHEKVRDGRLIDEAALSFALGIGYAPRGLMKGQVAIPIRLPTGDYVGITEAKLPKEFHLSNVVTFPKKTA
jgi:hypothetical protein